MEVKQAIHMRRAYRSGACRNNRGTVKDLAESAQCLSCFNNQPWRFVFVYDHDDVKEVAASCQK
jgi:nitroreductase